MPGVAAGGSSRQPARGPSRLPAGRLRPSRGRRRRVPARRVPVGRPRRLVALAPHLLLRALRRAGPAVPRGRQHRQPLPGLQHVVPQQEPQRPRLADPRLLVDADQPDEGRLQPSCSAISRWESSRRTPTLYMFNATAYAIQGVNVAFPGYLPFNPGTAIPFGGPQKLLQVYQDFNWVQGRHDIRFGGLVRATSWTTARSAPTRTPSRASATNAGQGARQPHPRPDLPLPGGRRPAGQVPRRDVQLPVGLPELHAQQPLQRVGALLQRHVERDRPAEAEPRRALRVLRRAAQHRSQPRLELLLRRGLEPLRAGAQRQRPRSPPTRRSAACGRRTRTTSPPASASPGT